MDLDVPKYPVTPKSMGFSTYTSEDIERVYRMLLEFHVSTLRSTVENCKPLVV